jgi:hypothetical protein
MVLTALAGVDAVRDTLASCMLRGKLTPGQKWSQAMASFVALPQRQRAPHPLLDELAPRGSAQREWRDYGAWLGLPAGRFWAAPRLHY